MLLEFSVKNYRSFKEEQTLSMVASKLTGHERDNLFESDDMNVLKSAIIYGANASGKSNFIKAFGYMKSMVLNSVQISTKEYQLTAPVFLLDEAMEEKASEFKILIKLENNKYHYHFAVKDGNITFERLSFWPHSREALLFERSDKGYKFGSYFKEEAKDLEDKTAPKTLFLTVAAQFNSNFAQRMMNWFHQFNVISGSVTGRYQRFTANKVFEKEDFKNKVSALMYKADLGIESIDIREIEEQSLPESLPEELRESLINKKEVFSLHKVRRTDGGEKLVRFHMDTMESEGTRRYFDFAGPIIDTLENGGVLVVDELDAKLHPHLTRHIILMFNSEESNPNKAQLIFANHNTSFLSQRYFRRDQIWFIEKNEEHASELYALSDYKDESGGKVRKDRSLENEYNQGKYGAVPYISE